MKRNSYSTDLRNLFISINLWNDAQMMISSRTTNEYVIIDIERDKVRAIEDMLLDTYGVVYEDILCEMLLKFYNDRIYAKSIRLYQLSKL